MQQKIIILIFGGVLVAMLTGGVIYLKVLEPANNLPTTVEVASSTDNNVNPTPIVSTDTGSSTLVSESATTGPVLPYKLDVAWNNKRVEIDETKEELALRSCAEGKSYIIGIVQNGIFKGEEE
jgi:hypothetical protein